MDGLPKLSPKARPEKLVKPRTFWLTEDMDRQINHLQELRGKNVVIEWLRSCWKHALTEAMNDSHLSLIEAASEAVNLDHEYDY